MTTAVRGASAALLAMALMSVSARIASADCVDDGCPNATVVEPVRQMVAAACDCEGAKSHKKYVRCAKQVVKSAVRSHILPAECKRTIRRCEARSTCGIDGAMVCCAPKSDGTIKAAVTKKESRCRGKICTGALTTADACRADGTCAKARRGLRSFRSVQQVFATSCALSTCHSTLARQGELVLDTEGISYANLVGHASAHPEAQQQGLLRVAPGDPDNSYLIRKLRALGPGDPMPQSGGPLPDAVISMIADWIRRGALTTAEECPRRTDGPGTVCDDTPVDTGNFVWQPEPPLEVPAASAGIQLYTPPRDVPPGTEWETCYAFPLDPAAISAQIGGGVPVIRQQTYRMHTGSHHLLLYMYFGNDPGGWPQGYFPCQAANCINPGDCPSDAGDALIPVGGTQVAGTRYEVNYPQGLGIPLLGSGPVLIVNEHYTNPFQPAQPIYGEAWVNLYFYPPGEFKAILDGIFAVNFRDLLVEPFTSRTISSIWRPRNILTGVSTNAALFQLFGHMHKRGTEFQIDYVRDGHCSASQALCGRDADCACKPWQNSCTPGQTCVVGGQAEDTTIYYTTEWDAAPIIDFPAPYFRVGDSQLRPGITEGLRWTCTHTNGVAGDPAYPPKKCEPGCEACGWRADRNQCVFDREICLRYSNLACTTSADCPPGRSCEDFDCDGDGEAPPFKACGRVYGVNDPMPLVFGLLADDDMCNMFGYFIDEGDLGKIGP